MTNKLKDYSVTPASNNAASPNGWPEGMAPSGLNNSDREFAARVREWYNDSQWIDYGDTINSSTSATVSIAGDVTAQYVVGRAIRAGQSDAAIGYVTASTYSAPDTSITCAGLDLTGVTQIELGAVKAGNQLPNGVVLSLGASATAVTASPGDSTTKVATTEFVQDTVSIIRAGASLGGVVVQSTLFASVTASDPALDDTVPLVTEGVQVLSYSYACGTTDASVVVEAAIQGTGVGNVVHIASLFAGSVCIGSNYVYVVNSTAVTITCRGFHSPASTSAVTYSLRLGNPSGGTFNVNGSYAGARLLGGSSSAYLRIQEVKG